MNLFFIGAIVEYYDVMIFIFNWHLQVSNAMQLFLYLYRSLFSDCLVVKLQI